MITQHDCLSTLRRSILPGKISGQALPPLLRLAARAQKHEREAWEASARLLEASFNMAEGLDDEIAPRAATQCRYV
jgi:hypothetical protein